MYELLLEKPEQERQILSILVNKLGDIQKVIGSKVSYLLTCLIERHPNMRLHVVKEVEQVLYRSNVGLKAQYYGIVFLNQILLQKTNPNDQQLASKLVTIYFSLFNIFFKTLRETDEGEKQPEVKKKKRKYRKTKDQEKTTEEANSKLITESKIIEALLVGIHRAFPYVPFNSKNAKLYQDHLHHLFTITHSSGISGFSKAIYSLLVIFQIILAFLSESPSLSTETIKLQDRYYRALYETLLRKEIAQTSTNKQTAFLNLLYKSLKADPQLHRTKAIVKRLLQV